jgi:hypothetical protein
MNYKRKKFQTVQKPDFVEISNIYDSLTSLVNTYGLIKVVQHLGLVAEKNVSREFASKIWRAVVSNNDFSKSHSKDED